MSDPNQMPEIVVVGAGQDPQPVATVPQQVPTQAAADLTGLTADGHAVTPAPVPDPVREVYGAAVDMTPGEMIDPEQHLRGVNQAMKAWWRLKLVCEIFQGAAKCQRRLPVMTAPLGEVDPILETDRLEIDWHAPLVEAYKAQRQEEVQHYMHTLCLPMNNMFVRQYMEAMATLREQCLAVISAFTGGVEVSNLKDGVTFDQLVEATAGRYQQVRPRIQRYLDVSDAIAKEDYSSIPNLDLTSAVTAFDAIESDPNAREKFIASLVRATLQKQQGEIVGCLRIMAAATTRALNMMTAK